METWLVTGGAGFIGSNFIRSTLKERANVRIVNLDLLTYAGNRQSNQDLEGASYRFKHGDIGDEQLVESMLQEYSPTRVFHFAAETHVDRSIDHPAAFLQTNVLGTHHLLHSCREYLNRGRDVESFRFIHISTDEVYGSLGPQDAPFRETDPFRPNSPYAASKAGGDLLVRSFVKTYGFPAITTHCSNNYGPYQFPEKLIPLLLIRALEGKSLPIYGDGQHMRDWLHVSDHGYALREIADRGTCGESYHIGGDCELKNIELAEALCRILDELRPQQGSYANRIEFVRDRPGHDRRYAVDHSKLTQALGWAPRVAFQSGLRETIAWYLEHPHWWQPLKVRYEQERMG